MPARSPRSAFNFIAAGVVAGAVFAGPAVVPAMAEETVDPTARQGAALAGSPGEVGHPNKLRLTKPAAGAGAGAGTSKEAAKLEVPGAPDPAVALSAELRKGDDAAVAAVKKLGELGTPKALDVLLDELATGLSPKVAKAALDVLAARREHESNTFPVLSLYAHHRNPELRKQALTALAALLPPAPGTTPAPAPAAPAAPAGKPAKALAKAPAKVPQKVLVPPPVMPASTAAGPVVPLLIAALSDANADVRQVAAQALGDHREKSAEPYLIKLLLRKDASAPVALGQIGGPDTARALAEMIGNVPDGMILETLGELLKRPDFGPENVRVQVVKTIGKMPGAVTLDILDDYVKDTAKDKARPSRTEAQKIIEQRTAK